MCYSKKNSSYRSSRYSGSVVDTVQKKGHERDPPRQCCWQLPRWHLVLSIVPPLYSCTFKPRAHIFMSMWRWKKNMQRCGMLLAGPVQGQVCYPLAKKLTFPFLSQKALLTFYASLTEPGSGEKRLLKNAHPGLLENWHGAGWERPWLSVRHGAFCETVVVSCTNDYKLRQ